MDSIVFQLGQQTLHYPDSAKQYVDLNNKFEDIVEKVLYIYRRINSYGQNIPIDTDEYDEYFHLEIDNPDSSELLVKIIENIGLADLESFLGIQKSENGEYIAKLQLDGLAALINISKKILRLLAERGIYTYDYKTLLTESNFGVSAIDVWSNAYSQIFSIYIKIKEKAQAQRDYRAMNKATRMRVVGGGFGISGALQGMIEAGAMNMATGAAYSIYNYFGNSNTDKEEAKSLAELYADERILNTLTLVITSAVQILKLELCKKLDISIIAPSDVKQAAVIMKNILSGTIPKEQLEQATTQVLQLDPYNKDAYIHYLLIHSDPENKLQNIADFWGIGNFLKQLKRGLVRDTFNYKFINPYTLKKTDDLDYDPMVEAQKLDKWDGKQSFWQFVEGKLDIMDAAFLVDRDGTINHETIQEYIDFFVNVPPKLGIQDEFANVVEALKNLQQLDITSNNSDMNSGTEIVSQISPHAHYQDKGLIDLTVPDEIEEIGEYAFAYTENLKKISFSKSSKLRVIHANAFYGSGIKDMVTLPDGITEIGDNAFANCKGLTSITFPGSVKKIGKNVVTSQGSNQLSCVWLEDGIERIDDDVFADLRRCGYMLKDPRLDGAIIIRIPDSVSYISEKAFNKDLLNDYGSHYSRRIFIKCSQGSYAEKFCHEHKLMTTSLENYCYDEKSQEDGYTTSKGLFDEELIIYKNSGFTAIGKNFWEGKTGVTYITIPNSYRIIYSGAFRNCTDLSTVNFEENGVERIYSEAFKNCGCSKIEFPESLKYIGDKVFSNCRYLKSVILPSNLQTLGQFAFSGCPSLKIVRIPDGIQEIEEGCFSGTNNSSFYAVCNPETVGYKYCIEHGISVRTTEEEATHASQTKSKGKLFSWLFGK